ncbi:thiol:disulfide interchange protein DsbD precursor [mine drainage metagenome]|uniref:Thiol:disulfide interchange protein DsbD n=1 Tax=mine drainage metagenome TaxID=410659 RepID=A0A1J5SGV0_9ZZZZ
MKKFFISFSFIFFIAAFALAQTDSLVVFSVQSKRINDTIYEIKAVGKIKQGWHLYGINPSVQDLESVKFSFGYENAKEINAPSFDRSPEIINDAIFKKVNVFTNTVSVTQQIKIKGFIPATLKGTINSSLGKNDEFQQASQPFEVNLEGGIAVSNNAQKIKLTTVDLDHPVNDCGTKSNAGNNGLLSVFFLGFLGGLIALLTPCVFPMIPVTVSFFTKRSQNHKQAIRNGALYGFFILLIYVLASVPFHVLGNVHPEVFNNISTNSWLNIIFFIIFIVFAISFFGFFEITLPSGFANKADSKSGLTSVGGIFFMALTLVIVSFSCTGPILGTLLVGSLSGGAWQLTSGLAGFGLALALPFALFAIFPNWLHSLPKSGGWLDTVKKVLAFVEVALAFKFLSNADLVMHWGLIKRETFFALWILTSAGLTLYLFGILRLPHDYKGMKITNARKFVGVLAFLFTLYLIPGVTATKYANLQLLSGFPPPLHYSIYGKTNVREKGLEANVVNDFDKALQMAKDQNKPLLIDFTGWACVNCRKMEENVWTDPEVYNYISKNFILVSLYVDDKENLPIEQRFTYTTKDGNKKDIATIGDKWATFEAENFNQVTQPLYVILNTQQQLMNNPVGYTPNAKEFKTWLQCGKDAFDKK